MAGGLSDYSWEGTLGGDGAAACFVGVGVYLVGVGVFNELFADPGLIFPSLPASPPVFFATSSSRD